MNRIESVDVFRLFAILWVIAIHTGPFGTPNGLGEDEFSLAVQINQFARFAVPFFFILSGYFWGKKIGDGTEVKKISMANAKRLALILLAWSVIYLFPYDFSSYYKYGWIGLAKGFYWNVFNLTQNPVDLLFQGTKIHLWFLVSLLYCLLISTVFVAGKYIRLWVVCSVVFYLFYLSVGPYSRTPFGIHLVFNPNLKNPFFALIFFVSGYLLSKRTPTPDWLFKGILLAVFGYTLHVSESYFLHTHFGMSPAQGGVIGTYFFALGVALIALSDRPFLRIHLLGRWGRFTLGVYAIHLVFVDALHPIRHLSSSPFWEIGYVLIIFALSMISVWLLSKNEKIRKIVV